MAGQDSREHSLDTLRLFLPMKLTYSIVDSSQITLLEPERNWAKLFFKKIHLWLVEILE